jgi:hypothetical protein
MFRFFHAIFGLANLAIGLGALATGEYAGAGLSIGLATWLGYQQINWYA